MDHNIEMYDTIAKELRDLGLEEPAIQRALAEFFGERALEKSKEELSRSSAGPSPSDQASTIETITEPIAFKPTLVAVDGLSTFPTLSKPDQDRARQLAGQLKVNNSNDVIAFGSNTQQALGNFSSTFVDKVENKDLGEIGETLRELMLNLKEVDEKQNMGLIGKFFTKSKKKVAYAVAGYQKASSSIATVKEELVSQQEKLSSSNKDLDLLYDQNVIYYQDLNVLIAAGEYKIEELKTSIIPSLEEEARKSSDQMITQEVKDLYDYMNRLEKRIYDLNLTRQISIQQAPQIRLIQKTNMDLVQKIQSSINTAIPLWSNQVALYITLMQQEGAIKATKVISDTTNKLLVKNSEMLKMGSIAAATETERGVVDLETLKITQGNLISTIEETLAIQRDGAKARAAAAIELAQLENTLKDKLLEITTDYKKTDAGMRYAGSSDEYESIRNVRLT